MNPSAPTHSNSLRLYLFADAVCRLPRHWASLHSERWLGLLNTLALPQWCGGQTDDVNNARQEAEGRDACLDFWEARRSFHLPLLCPQSSIHPIYPVTATVAALKLYSLIYSAAPGGLTVCACVCVCRWVVLTLRNGFWRGWWLVERDGRENMPLANDLSV